MSAMPVSQLQRLLCAATSSDAAERVPAHQQLQELESRPGFVSLLLEAYADHSGDPQSRYLAIVMCKNVVERHWQPRSGQCIGSEEKKHTKDRLLQLLQAAIACQGPHLPELAMVLRKICRFDFPRQWDELAPFLIAQLQSLQQHGFNDVALGVAMVLHSVLKEQATKKLITARKDFHQIGQVLLDPLGLVWCALFERMRQELTAPIASGDDMLWRLSRYFDGCFLILLAQGFAHLHDSPTGPSMVLLLRDKVALLLSLLLHAPNRLTQQCPFFLKGLKSVLKWWAVLLHAHPLAFAQAGVAKVLHMSVEVLQNHARAAQEVQLPEGIFKSSLQMLTHGFNTIAYRKGPQPAHQGVALEAAHACHNQFAEFLQRHHVDFLCVLCCNVAFRLSPTDLHMWLADPEDQLQGPSSQTELHIAGENFVRALGQAPLEQPVVEHVARRMKEEATRPPALGDAFEAVVEKDTLLALLSLCQPLLRPHLEVVQLLGFAAPIASLVTPQMGEKVPCVLLPVRLCAVIRSWAADIPSFAVMPVLQLLVSFLQEGSPKAVRLAALGPLRSMLDRFSDHEAWTHLQGSMIDACLGLLQVLTTPESQWRCLNLVHLFLCEEAETGQYEATERSMQRLLTLWRQPEQGELLICHAVLDVLRALVLVSCRSRQPRRPLSEALLSCSLQVVSDCFANHSVGSSGASTMVAEASAALETDAIAAVGRVGDRGSASATLFDSGSLLFLGILRTVDVDQSGPLLGLFPRLLEQYSEQSLATESSASLHDNALDTLLEYCALYVAIMPNGVQLQLHYDSLTCLCNRCLQKAPKDRNCEQCFQMLQLLLAYAAQPSSLQQLLDITEPLLREWATTFSIEEGPNSFRYPLHSVLPLFCTWQAHHREHFKQRVRMISPSIAHVAALFVACCRVVRPVVMRVSMLVAALSLAEEGGTDEHFWQTFLQCCDELILSAQKMGAKTLLSQALQSFRSSLATKLPAPARSAGELQCAVLPRELRPSLKEDGTFDEVALVRWFFECSARALCQLSATCALNPQALLMSASDQVREAFRATGV